MKKKQIAGMILAGIVGAGTIISSAFPGNVYGATHITINDIMGDGKEWKRDSLFLEVGESYSLLNELDDVMVYFNDVKNQQSAFFNPIYRAAALGITTGFDDNTFRQDDTCTRGQIVTFMYRELFDRFFPDVYLGIGESYSLLSYIIDHHNDDYYKEGLYGNYYIDHLYGEEIPINDRINDIKEKGEWWSSNQSIYNDNNDVYLEDYNLPDRVLTVDSNGTVTGRNLGSADVRVDVGEWGQSFWIDVVKTFGDVKNRESAFFNPIYWAASEGITTGFEDNTFRPDDSCTRGQIVTFLWRLAGEPEPKSKNTTITDLNEESVFYKAILWALENGITTGFDDNTFRQDDTCTRGQAMTFLYRSAKKIILPMYYREGV